MKRGGYLRGRPMHHSDIPRILKHYAAHIGLDPKDIAGTFAKGWLRYQRSCSSCAIRQDHGG